MKENGYCSYDVSILLYEAGLNVPSSRTFVYSPPVDDMRSKDFFLVQTFRESVRIPRPTHQDAFAALRGIGIFFCIRPDYPANKDKFVIEYYKDREPSECVGSFDQYDEAFEEGLKRSLEFVLGTMNK